MTPPETSDQGNMVSQRQVEWVLVPREPTARMLADAVMYAVAHEPSKADMAITGAVLEFLPPTGHPDARAVIAEIARDYRALLLSAPPAEPRADEGGVSGAERESSASPAHPMGEGQAGKRASRLRSLGIHVDSDGERAVRVRADDFDWLLHKLAICPLDDFEQSDVALIIRREMQDNSVPARQRSERAAALILARLTGHPDDDAPPLVAAGEPEAALSATDTQITQPPHDDEGLIERLRRIAADAEHGEFDCVLLPEKLTEALDLASRLKGELEEARYVKARYDRETIPELAGTAQEHFAGRLKAEAEVKELREGLEFYADPETYHACGFMFDPPCGLFREDFSEDHDHPDYDRPMPGKLARSILSLSQEGLSSARASRDARSST